MRSHRFALILAGLGVSAPAALAAQHTHCPSVTFSDLVANPITGDVRGTEISITMGQKGCIVLVKVAEGRFGPTKVGTPFLVGDSLSFQLLQGGGSFAGTIVRDTLVGRFDHPGAKDLALPRTQGATVVHEH